MRGIFTAPVTPFDANNKISEEAIARLFKKNIAEDVTGFFIGGSSGECFLLSFEERMQLFGLAAKYKGSKKIIAHVGAISTDEAIAYGQEAKRLGFDGIAATAPFYFKFSPAAVADYYYDIAKEVGMPVMVYNFPGNTGYEFDLGQEDIRAMFQSKAIWGVKHTNLNLYQLERIKHLNPELLMYNGFDEVLISGLAIGADGAIGSTFNVMYPHYQEIKKLFEELRIDEARELQIRANNIMEAFCQVGLIPAIKHVLTLQEIEAGVPRRPFKPLSTEQKRYIERVWNENIYQK